MLTRDAILAADDLPRELVYVEAWKDEVYVRTLTGVGRDAFEQAVTDARGKGERVNIAGLKALLVTLTVCDESGAALFGPEDAEALNAKCAAAIDHLYQVASRLNALTPADAEELVGN